MPPSWCWSPHQGWGSSPGSSPSLGTSSEMHRAAGPLGRGAAAPRCRSAWGWGEAFGVESIKLCTHLPEKWFTAKERVFLSSSSALRGGWEFAIERAGNELLLRRAETAGVRAVSPSPTSWEGSGERWAGRALGQPRRSLLSATRRNTHAPNISYFPLSL